MDLYIHVVMMILCLYFHSVFFFISLLLSTILNSRMNSKECTSLKSSLATIRWHNGIFTSPQLSYVRQIVMIYIIIMSMCYRTIHKSHRNNQANIGHLYIVWTTMLDKNANNHVSIRHMYANI